jgi:integral membrane protein
VSTTRSTVTAISFEGAFRRYRIMSFVVGVMLLFLCLVAVPLQIAHKPALAHVGFTIHGVVYIVYLLSAGDLALRAKFRLGRLIGLVCAGFVPGLAFYVEHRTAQSILAGYGTGSAPGVPAAESRSAK